MSGTPRQLIVNEMLVKEGGQMSVEYTMNHTVEVHSDLTRRWRGQQNASVSVPEGR
jgi:hypothetical protein